MLAKAKLIQRFQDGMNQNGFLGPRSKVIEDAMQLLGENLDPLEQELTFEDQIDFGLKFLQSCKDLFLAEWEITNTLFALNIGPLVSDDIPKEIRQEAEEISQEHKTLADTICRKRFEVCAQAFVEAVFEQDYYLDGEFEACTDEKAQAFKDILKL